MKHQQAIFLQEMGITHWKVRKPALFKTEDMLKQLNLSVCELLVVCTEQDKNNELMRSIINAFAIDTDNVVYCTMEQFKSQQGNLPNLIWTTLGEITVSANTKLLNSPSLAILANDGEAKKNLWKQYCAYQQ